MTKIDGLEFVMTKHIISEIDKELKKRLDELKPELAKRYEELLNMRNMETDQFNDGFNDARAGKLETDHPHYDLDTDNWRLGYAWGVFEPMKEEVNKLSAERDELYLTISSCENANEIIQIMLEQSQEENGKLRNVLRQISEMSGFDIGDQTKYFQRIATAALIYPEPSPSDVSVTQDIKTSSDNNKQYQDDWIIAVRQIKRLDARVAELKKVVCEAENDAKRLADEYESTLREIGGVWWEDPYEKSPALIAHKIRSEKNGKAANPLCHS